VIDLGLLNSWKKSLLYDNNPAIVKKYCYRDFRAIDTMWTSSVTYNEHEMMIKEKSRVWEIADRLSKIEKGLLLSRFIRWRLFMFTALAIIAGICLNIRRPEATIAGGLILYTGMLTDFYSCMVTVVRVYRLVIALPVQKPILM
jgi:hypothetical protein